MSEEGNDAVDLDSFDMDFDEMEKFVENFASDVSVRSVLKNEVDLRVFNQKINLEIRDIENEIIKKYLEELPNVQNLCDEIIKCENVLNEADGMLNNFNELIKSVSDDIIVIQEQYEQMRTKLKNRTEFQNYLSAFVKSVVIPKSFIKDITENEVGLQYVDVIESLNEKMSFITSSDIPNSKLVQETVSILSVLKQRAAENIKRWFFLKIDEMIKYTETRNSVQDTILKCKPLFIFLHQNFRDAEKQIIEYYINIFGQYYVNYFRNYCYQITMTMSQSSFSNETIAPHVTQSSFFFKKKIAIENSHYFSLGDRKRYFDNVFDPPDTYENGTYPIESLYRSLYMILHQRILQEYSLTTNAFNYDITYEIFYETLKAIGQLESQLVSEITDPICLVIIIKILISHEKELSKLEINNIGPHFGKTIQMFIDRFNSVISFNLSLLENARSSLLFSNEETAHHTNVTTRRFYEFVLSMITLSDDITSDIVLPELYTISAGFCLSLENVSREFKSPVLSDVFLINNYYMVLTAIQTVKQIALYDLFQQKITESTSRYIELELKESFPSLWSVINKSYERVENNGPPKYIEHDEVVLRKITMDFQNDHVARIKKIAEKNLSLFCDFLNGKEMLKQVAKRVVLYWTKFEELCTHVFANRQRPTWLVNILTTHQLVLNINSPQCVSFDLN